MKIKLPKGKYLSQIEPFITKGLETNIIYHKEVTGCGITTYAFKCFKQHTISCLPNRPVIEDKVAKHNEKCKPNEKILGVHKGIDVEDIIDYLNNEEITYKKILTTPEGFIDKVVPAFGENVDMMYSEYFLLLDECERVITDISYRGKIAAPFNLFFDFHNKAMVSATVLPFSDERLNDFKHYYIQPNYDYSKPITVIETNSVVEALKARLQELNSEHILIFLNSTDTILAVADRLGIKGQSHAYCSEKSAIKLMLGKFNHSSKDLDVKELGKYNFLTSRFFSAFDITLKYKPDVIMVTDVFFAEHSILDPQTEVIQIAGRCRNGVNSLTHITNFDVTLMSKSVEEAKYYLNGCFDTYNSFLDFYEKSDHPGVKDTLWKAIEESLAHTFYNNGKLNTFMIDNYINEERVKGYYQHADHLKVAYGQQHNHFKVTYQSQLYALTDGDRKRIRSGMTAKQYRKEIAHQLHKLTSRHNNYSFVSIETYNYLRSLDQRLTKTFDVIGLQGLESTEYVYSKMDKAVKEFKTLEEFRMIAPAVYVQFNPFTVYPESEVLKKLTQIRNEATLCGRTTATMITKFFKAKRSSRKRVVVWILEEKHSLVTPILVD